jgi:hypothetical protein
LKHFKSCSKKGNGGSVVLAAKPEPGAALGLPLALPSAKATAALHELREEARDYLRTYTPAWFACIPARDAKAEAGTSSNMVAAHDDAAAAATGAQFLLSAPDVGELQHLPPGCLATTTGSYFAARPPCIDPALLQSDFPMDPPPPEKK